MNKKNQIKINKNKNFNQWLAGLIDGDGYFGIVNKKYPQLEITVELRDEPMLTLIQNKYGGSIKLRSGVKAVRYRLSKKEHLIKLVNDINGNIRNSKRMVQYDRVCDILNIKVKPLEKLSINNGWFMGFFDADGTINYYYRNTKTKVSTQIFLSVSNKYKHDVEEFSNIFGGKIYFDKKGYGSYKWNAHSEDVLMNYYNYNKLHPSRSQKGKRIFLIKEYYTYYNKMKDYNIKTTPLIYKSWLYFEENKWKRK